MLSNTKIYTTSGSKKYTITYSEGMDAGGGNVSSQVFVDYIKSKYKNRKFKNCLDWCSGPGFIGFELLDNNLCKNLFLLDSYPPNIKCAKNTIESHSIANAKTLTCNRLKYLKTNNKFDLIVGVPPWSASKIVNDHNFFVYGFDENWTTHKNFFDDVSEYLTDDGIIILGEGTKFTNIDTFKNMFSNKLQVNNVEYLSEYSGIYFIELSKIS